MIGQTISQYKITAKLGAGGMGEVYLATDSKLHREVALKFLPQQFSNDPDARSRFQREARALAALNHPNIVTVHDVSEYDGQPFIAMEYLRGKSLKDIISEGDIALERVIDFAYQTAQGLAAAHKAEVVHRDVKSENIIVSPEGRVKIMDFGLATWRGVTQITKEGSTVGTMSYMSPEQAQGKDVDQRTDLWSLGVVLYEMLTGRLPFQGDHEAAVVYAIVQDTPQPPLRYRSGIPSGLDEIVTKALEKDPETRYQTATGFLSDITRFRKASEASLAGTSTTSHAKAPKRSLLPLVISVATVIALVVFKPWQSGSSRDESQPSAVKTLVVLPFENLGGSEDEYFADGITEEITSRLARIAGLRVISRTSAIQYKGTNKRLRQIGDELGVAYVLEGTIRWDKSGDTNRVRITPQLIKVEDDFHIWTEVYERAMIHIFAVQGDIAEHIASALDVTLDGRTVTERPTDDLGAYDFYLRGQEYLTSGTSEADILTAIGLFEHAIAQDSSFAEPYAAIGRELSARLLFSATNEEELRTKARTAIDRALELAPNLASAHAALGWYYNWVDQDYDLALEEFTRARELGANEGDVYHAIAQVQMRQGRWLEAEENLQAALAHDPRSTEIMVTLAELYTLTRRFEDGMRITNHALILAPDNDGLYNRKALLLIVGYGDTAGAAVTVRDAVTRLNSVRVIGMDYYGAEFYVRLWRFRLVDVTPAQVTSSFVRTTRRNELRDQIYGLASVYNYRGQLDSAKYYYDSVITLLKVEIQEAPDDFHPKSNLGLACLLAGYREEALRYAGMGVDHMSISSCHW